MEKQKHTPGPWTVDEERETDIVIRNPNRDPVALGYLSGWDKKTARANARLIAAAPELLEACKVAEGYFRGLVSAEYATGDVSNRRIALLQKAIAKAEAEGEK